VGTAGATITISELLLAIEKFNTMILTLHEKQLIFYSEQTKKMQKSFADQMQRYHDLTMELLKIATAHK
jgi:hypothetical protein